MKIETVKSSKQNKTNNSGGISMKKTFFVVFLAVMALMLVSSTSFAGVSGVCSNCHTMHASQDGVADGGGANGAPIDNLLKSNCIACHTDTGMANDYVIRGAKVDNNTLSAAGTFDTTIANDDTKRHNVVGLDSADPNFAGNVPGGTIAYAGNQVTCSGGGTTGCHAPGGFHHADTMYRGLTDTTGLGVTNREYGGATATNHNVYKSGTNGISLFCATCHGAFHGDGNTGGPTAPFTRHPTDLNIGGNSTNGFTVDAATYNNNPPGFASLVGKSTTTAYDATGAQVTCISCHRAHGSANADILRFAYATQVAGGAGETGCLDCHVRQR